MPPKSDNHKDADYLQKLRHTTAHVLAEAVKQLYPEAKLTLGPPTEDGFYYDFDSPHRFTEEDLQKIEKQMKRNSKNITKMTGEEKTREEARHYWEEIGEKYKVEIIAEETSGNRTAIEVPFTTEE